MPRGEAVGFRSEKGSGVTSGRWEVRTESGTTYVLDLDAMTMTRSAGADANMLRKDDETVPLLDVLTTPTVGKSMSLLIDVRGDGVVTIRQTTAVTAIRELEDA